MRQPSKATLLREYRCDACGGRPVERTGGSIECGRCGGAKLVHECEVERRRAGAIEALDALRRSEFLPPELAAALGIEEKGAREPVLVSLCPEEIEI